MTEIEFVNRASATLIDSMGGDNDVAMAAWVSFAADNEDRLENQVGVEKLIAFLMREEHNTPFEHVVLKYRVDCPIFVAREYHRHRSASYNEVSGRYTVMPGRFYLPGEGRPVVQQGKAGQYYFVEDQRKLEIAQDEIAVAVQNSWEAYESMLNQGIAKEVARMVLPVNLMTQFYVTMNARNVLHFLGLRTSPQALYEIRQVAEDMEKIIAEKLPLTYKAYQTKQSEWAAFKEWKESQK